MEFIRHQVIFLNRALCTYAKYLTYLVRYFVLAQSFERRTIRSFLVHCVGSGADGNGTRDCSIVIKSVKNTEMEGTL